MANHPYWTGHHLFHFQKADALSWERGDDPHFPHFGCRFPTYSHLSRPFHHPVKPLPSTQVGGWRCPKLPAGGARDCGWRTQFRKTGRKSWKSFCFHGFQWKHLPLQVASNTLLRSNWLGLPSDLSQGRGAPETNEQESLCGLSVTHWKQPSWGYSPCRSVITNGGWPLGWSSPTIWPTQCETHIFNYLPTFKKKKQQQAISHKTLTFQFLLKILRI